MPRKRRKSRITRSNLPLILAGVFVVGAAVLFLTGGDEDDGVPIPVTVDDAPTPQPEPDVMPDSAGDPIGDLIASLDPEPDVQTAEKPTWRKNAVAAAPDDGRPMIALVIDDVGLNEERSADTIALPAPITLAFLPYADDLRALTKKARRAGHETMVHVPMEPSSATVDPGPHAMRVGLSDSELRQRLAWNLDRFDGYVGFNNHMGSKFTADSAGMRVVIDEAKRRGLLFLDSRTTKETRGRELAEQAGVPVVERQVFLDNKVEAAAVEAQLKRMEQIARDKGAALAIGHPHAVTIAALRNWLRQNTEFAVVPVSALVMRGAGTNGGAVDPAYSDELGY